MQPARIVLDNEVIYHGSVFAHGNQCFGELIFNTSMSGYEEVLTDPSYKNQFILMTYPLIGNYGINENNIQSNSPHLSGLIVHEYMSYPSNWESKQSLKDYLEHHNIMGIEGIDTRHLTRSLRHKGAMNAYITADSSLSDDDLIQNVLKYDGITGKNLAKQVSTDKPYSWAAPDQVKFKVAVIDCGVKYSILNQLQNLGCQVTVFPYNTPSKDILSQDFDGVLVSNGPGDPSAVHETIQTIKELAGNIPMFGICLGHQMICHAFDFKLVKLPFGHHGINHPIKNLATGNVEISSQNHIYCATDTHIPDSFAISHLNLNDNTVAGIRSDSKLLFSVQYHPEAAPGPFDSHYLFLDFIYLMQHKQFRQSMTPSLEVNR
ncbi:carbamoyl phosphate synthase small subunit [Candidatus Marinamargulisbacteria bacterium SCGC AG-333-B06]|nr:carbamoyl phosphate synthase small subunit [Candidatus Marinamargulisbacteria bacterium SCGC AG-333-B06]